MLSNLLDRLNEHKLVLTFFSLALVIFVGAYFVVFKTELINPKISLESEVEGFHLAWQNRAILEDLLSSQGVFDQGVFLNEDSSYHPIKRVKIILSKNELSTFPVNWVSSPEVTESVNASSSYFEVYDTDLILKVYVIDHQNGLENERNRDIMFNYQLGRLILYATAKSAAAEGQRTFTTNPQDNISFSTTYQKFFDLEETNAQLKNIFANGWTLTIKGS